MIPAGAYKTFHSVLLLNTRRIILSNDETKLVAQCGVHAQSPNGKERIDASASYTRTSRNVGCLTERASTI
jgi:hypothetical protein